MRPRIETEKEKPTRKKLSHKNKPKITGKHKAKVFWTIFMRNKNNKHLGIEIDQELHYKLHYISKYYSRSANGEILYLIIQEIKAFEKS